MFRIKAIGLELDEAMQGTGRTYPSEVISKAIEVLPSPLTGSFTNDDTYFKENIINWDKVNIDDKKLLLEGLSVNNDLRTMLSSGTKLGIALRGYGTFDEKNIATHIEILSFDITLNPSNPHCYITHLGENHVQS